MVGHCRKPSVFYKGENVVERNGKIGLTDDVRTDVSDVTSDYLITDITDARTDVTDLTSDGRTDVTKVRTDKSFCDVKSDFCYISSDDVILAPFQSS